MASNNTTLGYSNGSSTMITTTAIIETFFKPDDILLPIIRCCIGVTGIIGNLLVCIVVVRLWSTNKRNATNILIANQALIDLFASIILVTVTMTEIFEVPPPNNYFFGQIICKFWSSRFLLFAAFTASTINLTEISIERYLAVIHPIYYSMKFANTTIAKILPAIPWLIGPIWQFIIALLRYDFIPSSVSCTYEAESYTDAMEKIFGVIVFLWDYFIPVLIMTFAFIKIVMKFRQQNLKVASRQLHRPPQGSTVPTISTMRAHQNSVSEMDQNSPMDANISIAAVAGDINQASSSNQPERTHGPKPSINIQRRNVTKTLFIVYVVYVICWSPDQWAFLQYNLGGSLNFGSLFVNFAIMTAQLNSCVNPFIYGLQYKQYRKGLTKLLKCTR